MSNTDVITVDHHDAIRALQEVVKGKEEFVYDSKLQPEGTCRYEDENHEPSCLIGHALRFLNPNVQFPCNTDTVYIATYPWHEDPFPGCKLTGEAADVFGRAQIYQDKGEPWGKAVEEALVVYLDLVVEKAKADV